MEFKIDSSRPVYQQIMGYICQAVLSNTYPPGSRIPSVRDLAAEMKVNPNTIQRAMTELEQQGLLISNGTLGKSVTNDLTVVNTMRQASIRAAVDECRAKFHALGLSMEEAAQLLLQNEEV